MNAEQILSRDELDAIRARDGEQAFREAMRRNGELIARDEAKQIMAEPPGVYPTRAQQVSAAFNAEARADELAGGKEEPPNT